MTREEAQRELEELAKHIEATYPEDDPRTARAIAACRFFGPVSDEALAREAGSYYVSTAPLDDPADITAKELEEAMAGVQNPVDVIWPEGNESHLELTEFCAVWALARRHVR